MQWWRRAGFLLVFGLLGAPRMLAAQSDTASVVTTPSWVGHFTSASANALLSGVTAGLVQELKGGSFRDGFTRGALGGVVIYAGKRVAADRFTGAGLLGREVAAVGTSMVRNAADGIGTFDRVVLPVGITRLYWQRAAPRGVQVKLDVVALGWTIYGIVEPELHFEAEESFSAGTPVFSTDNKVIDFSGDDEHAAGVVEAGVIFRADVRVWGRDALSRAFAHERMHVLQMDQLFLTLNDPHDDWLLRQLPGGRKVARYVDLNGAEYIMTFLSALIDEHDHRPWELEAIHLAR